MKQNFVLALMSLVAIWSTDARAQSVAAQASVPVAVPAPAPPLAAAQETLSARTLVRLEQLTHELSETVGRVEALEGAVATQKAENERLVGLIDANRAAQIAQSAPEANTAKAISDEQAAAIMANTADTNTGATPTTALNTDMFIAPVPPPLSPAIMLTNAQTALQSGSYPIAEANLTQLIWVHPASPEASEGRWLLGEARFVQAAWGTAAQAYVDYLKATPQGPRATEALVRLAGTFRQLGDNRQRCLALAEFKRRAPRPDATLKARADGEIARMACPAV